MPFALLATIGSFNKKVEEKAMVKEFEGNMAGKLVIKVVKIKGRCPVYSVGDRIVLEEGYKLNLKETTNVCMHSLASIMPYYNALYNGIAPEKLGLANKEGKACVQCLDPCEITGGGTVIFEIELLERE